MTCCFDGYTKFELSYQREENYIKLKKSIINVLEDLIKEGFYNYLCGFDRGCDLLFAQCIIELKSKYHNITLRSVLPFEEQASTWSEIDRELYFSLLSQCDKEIIIRPHYERECYEIRDRFMVEKSDIVIAVYDGKLSLTMKTIKFAKQLCKMIICINPDTFTITKLNSSANIYNSSI